ncbi:MAG TPA: L-serine ammonia-lyase, iron-sulfur-dependent, subunit alpha, partial [Atribacterota bacterium]|nr:L-serine ammonia-lyase, iron-sulfur-dependent, subunit alpha [Atribacterota bacterium]
MKNNYNKLLNLLKNSIVPATGCTEPVAVAYAVARASEELAGKDPISIEVQVDSNIYKNGLMVTIPGTRERGLLAAAAFGFLFGRTERGLRVIEGLRKKDIQKARDLLARNKISVTLNPDFQGIHIEVLLTAESDKVRVITRGSHLNIISVEKTDRYGEFKSNPTAALMDNTVPKESIREYSLADFFEFSNKIAISELGFLNEGVQMNLAIAKEGMKIGSGVGQALVKLVREGLISDNMVTYAQILCAAASEARMGGSSLPVMSTAGSGNHGITAFLTNCAVAEKQNLSNDQLLRSLALTNLITLFIKSYTGTLSAMCGCGVAAGIGASAGVVYLL